MGKAWVAEPERRLLSSQTCLQPAIPSSPGNQHGDYPCEPWEMTVFMAEQCLLELKGLK